MDSTTSISLWYKKKRRVVRVGSNDEAVDKASDKCITRSIDSMQ
jgi:hypothetical protein